MPAGAGRRPARWRAVGAAVALLATAACLPLAAATEKAGAAARSTLVLLDGTHVTSQEAFSVQLVKGVVDSKRRAELLLQLKFMQMGLDADLEMLHENRRTHMRRHGAAAGHHRHQQQHHRVLEAEDAEEEEEERIAARQHFRAAGAGSRHHGRRAHHEEQEEGGHAYARSRDANMRFAQAEAAAEAGAENVGHHHKQAAAHHSQQQQQHAAHHRAGEAAGSKHAASAGAGVEESAFANAAGAVVRVAQTADVINGLGVAMATGGAAAATAARAAAANAVSVSGMGVDIDNEPLQAQILSQKRLATYYGEVHIGGQSFKVLFDTGSCEFWVPSHNCAQHTKPAARCGKHSQYNPSASAKFHRFAQQPKMLIQYLSGKVEGPLGVDDVKLGSLVVPNQIFGIAETIDVPLLDEVRWDGIMGLAYPSSTLSRKGVRPVFDNIMDQRLLKDAIFGYYLGPRGGVVTFGAVDRQYVQHGSEFVFASVTHQGYWTIGIKDIVLKYPGTGEVSTGVCRNGPHGMCKAIVDTGTYLVYGPAGDVKGALRDIQTSTCDRVGSLPSLVFVLHNKDAPTGTVNVTLAPHDYTLDFRVPVGNVPADECSQAQYDHPDGQGIDPNRCARDCVTGIAPDADTLWTLGQVFLRNYYAVFDRAHNRIGFARAVATGSI